MIVKYQALLANLKLPAKSIYILVGRDPYLRNEALLSIKKHIRLSTETDESIIEINNTADWELLIKAANSYTLFADLSLIDARFNKKVIDADAKAILTRYLQNPNANCIIIMQLGAVPVKQLQWFANHKMIMIVDVDPLSSSSLQSWIIAELKSHAICYEPQVPALIYQYSQNNMLASAQIILQLAFASLPQQIVRTEELIAQLNDHSEFQLYELADACLAAQSVKALYLIRQACNNKTAPTLVLWALSQEIRQLLQLTHLIKQGFTFDKACKQLNIWTKRTKLYESSLARLPISQLFKLLQNSKMLDERIKTNKGYQLWQSFEKLVLLFCNNYKV